MKFLPVIFISLLIAATTALPTDDNPAVSENICAAIRQAQENRDSAKAAYRKNPSLENLKQLNAANDRLASAVVVSLIRLRVLLIYTELILNGLYRCIQLVGHKALSSVRNRRRTCQEENHIVTILYLEDSSLIGAMRLFPATL
ncbi:hypothetical protein BDV37DRAFT_210094 [Aspergillus pseudonomiae]|uniref:Uncharacterized protein n=1 Tax=Aspergillus pseudonomiae TaxID=1506151 RepID=A0A5N7D2Z7_9EURO|nr:uncharacterized protein BDV37DRAFT_210094 [Aspergillus pseudonomiae]KAE8400253.1 hypothetical protein BDV37DRAFT_210094 [Aspergillus pseudonomiae]